jgi:hypothetical protein
VPSRQCRFVLIRAVMEHPLRGVPLPSDGVTTPNVRLVMEHPWFILGVLLSDWQTASRSQRLNMFLWHLSRRE